MTILIGLYQQERGLGLGGVLRDRRRPSSWALRMSEDHMQAGWTQGVSSRGKHVGMLRELKIIPPPRLNVGDGVVEADGGQGWAGGVFCRLRLRGYKEPAPGG